MKLLTFLFLVFPLTTTAKSIDCANEFDWLKKTFEQNDAGFQYAISTKGLNNYQSHNVKYLETIKDINDINECYAKLQDWLTFFRDGHLTLSLNVESAPTEAYSSPIHDFDELAFNQYLKSKKKDNLEGIWHFSSYTVAIKKEGDKYNGYVIESTNSKWQKGQIKLTFHEIANNTYNVTYYMGDHSPNHIDSVNFIDDNHLILGNNFLTLSRQEPKGKSSPDVSRYIRLTHSSKPLFELISKETALLRIPSFDHSFKKDIDKTIKDNLDTILSTENLIIDIRDNGGGSDISYKEIMPIIYTNPVRTVGVEFLSTKLNNSRMLKFADDVNFSEENRKWAKQSFAKLEKHLGKFVNLNEYSVSSETLAHIHPLPNKVAVLIDNANASTAEQFLLAAKQSQKVKLFGITTRGVLDISNMYQVESPSKLFTLHYGLTKSFRVPEMAIDGKGIQPDFYIGSDIPIFQWISHVQKILEAK